MTDFEQILADRDALEELLALYVFGELDRETCDRLEARLAADTALAAEVASLRRTLDLLPHGVALEPPPALRERVLESARRMSPAQGHAHGDQATTAVTPSEGRLRATPLDPVRARRTAAEPSDAAAARMRRTLAVTRMVGAVAAVLAIAFGMDGWRLRREIAHDRDVTTVLTQPNVVQSFDLAGTKPASDAFGTVALDLDAKKAAVVLRGLPPLQPGSVYRLWAFVGDKKVPCGEFDVDERGDVVRQIPVPVDAYTEPVSKLALTIEPESLPAEPVGPIVMVSS